MMASAVLERFSSLDETISTIKDAHAREMQEARDARVAAEIEAELCRKLLAEANAERDSYMRVAVKLIAQFSMVEKVFSDAKQLAIEYAAMHPEEPVSYETEPAPAPVPETAPEPWDHLRQSGSVSEPKDGTP